MNEKTTAVQTATGPTNLKIVEPQSVFEHMDRIYDAIARRAYDLFERDGHRSGYDLNHWFEAEQELLHPAHIDISETPENLIVKTEVPGFSANELQVSLEPNRLTISGKKETTKEETKGKTIYKEHCSNQLFRVIDLPTEVTATTTNATLKDGILELTLPKAAQAKVAPTTKVQVRAA